MELGLWELHFQELLWFIVFRTLLFFCCLHWLACSQAFICVYCIAILVLFFQPLSPRSLRKPPNDDGSSWVLHWWLQSLLLDTCSCSRQAQGEWREGGGGLIACSCLCLETHHRLQLLCQEQVLAKWCFKLLFPVQLQNVVLSLVHDFCSCKAVS